MTGCKAGLLLAEDGPLTPEDRATLTPLLVPELGRVRYPASVVARALGALGHDVGPTTIKDHRASRCACTRTKA